jgi:hypothetical protein
LDIGRNLGFQLNPINQFAEGKSGGQGTKAFDQGGEKAEGQFAQKDQRIRAVPEVTGSQSESLISAQQRIVLT